VLAPIDALAIINDINELGARLLSPPNFDLDSPPFLDVSGDGVVSSIDALLVINAINDRAQIRTSASPELFAPLLGKKQRLSAQSLKTLEATRLLLRDPPSSVFPFLDGYFRH